MYNKTALKTHYVYLAIGVSIRYAKFGIFPLSFYVGVRTGVLPDRHYKTSSSTKGKTWLYSNKVILKTFQNRYEANRLERFLCLKAKRAGLWESLENRIVPPIGSEGFCFNSEAGKLLKGYKHSAETRKKMSESTKGQKFDKETLTVLQHTQWERKFPEIWAKARNVFYLKQAGCGVKFIPVITGYNDRTVRTMWERFAKGWDPNTDPDYLCWPYAEPLAPQETLDQWVKDCEFEREYRLRETQWSRKKQHWVNAPLYFQIWRQEGEPGNVFFARACGVTVSAGLGMHRKFKEGWDPTRCPFHKRWRRETLDNHPELS